MSVATPVGDPHRLGRFVAAQDAVWPAVLEELRDGRKRTHWMWFVFPQIAGLGHSDMAQRFAIGSAAEAKAYVGHALLGPRLITCTRLVLEVRGRTALAIFGVPDDAKFRSSMTLFAHAAPDESVFAAALDRYFGGQPDRRTLDMLGSDAPGAG